MNRKLRALTFATMASICAAYPAVAEPIGMTAGLLNCNVSSGWGLILGSSRGMSCVYTPTSGAPQHYLGSIKKFGVDIGYLSGATIVWAVAAPTSGFSPGALAGDYIGATGSASIGAGVGVNVLFGGFQRSVALQPVSLEGNQGLDVAGGIADVTLAYQQ
jgi:hypothetical protein